MKHIISVIVPIYRVEKYLDRCLCSIQDQTFSDYELFLVDDGSPDSCGVSCDDYVAEDSRIIAIHKPNGGLSDARNKALDLSTGEYISFVDSDDYVSDIFLEELFNSINITNCKLAVCSFISVSVDSNERYLYGPFEHNLIAYDEEIYESLIQPNACNKLFKADLFDKVRYPKGRLFEDAFIYHRILSQIDKLVYCGKSLYYYYVRSDSIMNSDYKLQNTDIVDAVYDRAITLDKLGYHKYADEAYLAVYSRLAGAYTLLNRNDNNVKLRLSELKKKYNSVFKRMITDKHYSLKQRFRLLLLFISPELHTKLFPMNTK